MYCNRCMNKASNTKMNTMKPIFITSLTLLASLLSGEVLAQTDTTTLQVGAAKVIIVEEEDGPVTAYRDDSYDLTPYTYWAGLDLGVNMLLDANGRSGPGEGNEWLELQHERSLSWRINMVEGKIKIAGHYLGLVSGLGLMYNSYGFRNETTVVSNTPAFPDTTFGVIDTVRQFSKTKLRATYLSVPLLLELNTGKDPENGFHLAVGAIGSWKIGSITKQRFEEDGATYEVRGKKDFNLSPLMLDLTARIGYRDLTLFATYSLTPLFREGRGPEVYPLTVGLCVVPW